MTGSLSSAYPFRVAGQGDGQFLASRYRIAGRLELRRDLVAQASLARLSRPFIPRATPPTPRL